MKLTLNLASRTYVNRRALYLIYALVLGALVLLLAFSTSRLWQLQYHSRAMEERLADLEKRLGEVEEPADPAVTPAALERQAPRGAIAHPLHDQDGFCWTALLDRLEGVALEGVSVSSLQPDYKERNLRLTGQARSVRELRSFLDRMIASPDFSEVYLLQQSNIKVKTPTGSERHAVGFSLVLKGVF